MYASTSQQSGDKGAMNWQQRAARSGSAVPKLGHAAAATAPPPLPTRPRPGGSVSPPFPSPSTHADGMSPILSAARTHWRLVLCVVVCIFLLVVMLHASDRAWTHVTRSRAAAAVQTRCRALQSHAVDGGSLRVIMIVTSSAPAHVIDVPRAATMLAQIFERAACPLRVRVSLWDGLARGSVSPIMQAYSAAARASARPEYSDAVSVLMESPYETVQYQSTPADARTLLLRRVPPTEDLVVTLPPDALTVLASDWDVHVLRAFAACGGSGSPRAALQWVLAPSSGPRRHIVGSSSKVVDAITTLQPPRRSRRARDVPSLGEATTDFVVSAIKKWARRRRAATSTVCGGGVTSDSEGGETASDTDTDSEGGSSSPHAAHASTSAPASSTRRHPFVRGLFMTTQASHDDNKSPPPSQQAVRRTRRAEAGATLTGDVAASVESAAFTAASLVHDLPAFVALAGFMPTASAAASARTLVPLWEARPLARVTLGSDAPLPLAVRAWYGRTSVGIAPPAFWKAVDAPAAGLRGTLAADDALITALALTAGWSLRCGVCAGVTSITTSTHIDAAVADGSHALTQDTRAARGLRAVRAGLLPLGTLSFMAPPPCSTADALAMQYVTRTAGGALRHMGVAQPPPAASPMHAYLGIVSPTDALEITHKFGSLADYAQLVHTWTKAHEIVST